MMLGLEFPRPSWFEEALGIMALDGYEPERDEPDPDEEADAQHDEVDDEFDEDDDEAVGDTDEEPDE